ncbi:acyl-CoA dehydrogenase family protein [Leptothoe sp. ISB3NOV94-8A]|uniref:acyl-CoA dehydrogenase family protein n=1 Tax=Adonisia turfae TaxID=2950184 RepID=UPI0020299F9F|nr:acyl-CoA dehydrogenase family protein [Adonisia turfae]MDV3349202.1 acyl-CoA dehydrogenase family protein [Leptothoe sp. LEGE 181152]
MSISFDWDLEQLSFYRSIVTFAQQELNADLIENDRRSHFNQAGWQKCADFGILGWPISKEYGGQGLDPLTTILGLEGLGYGCKDNGLVFAINNHLWSCAVSIANFGTEAQKQQYLPALCQGTSMGGHAITEPNSGSAAFEMQTEAIPHGDYYILNGTKTFISNAPVADVYITFARTNLEVGAQQGISAFIIHKDLPGLTIEKEWEKSGLRTAPMGELVFKDCKVPVNHRLGKEGRGHNIFQSTISWERSFLFASQVGTMERIFEQCVSYAKKRKQFGQPIGSFQGVSNKIAEMKMRLELAKLILYKIGWLKKEGKQAFLESSISKVFISEGFMKTCQDAIQIHGARGYVTDYELERYFRDSIAGTIYAGTSEIHRNIISTLSGV